jgi:hypothetical protein
LARNAEWLAPPDYNQRLQADVICLTITVLFLGGVSRFYRVSGPAMYRRSSTIRQVCAARLSADAVAVIVKDAAERVGLDPAIFAGHSLRSGFLTSAAKRGASVFKMMDVSRHRSVVGRYASRLRPRCRAVPGPRWRGPAVTD